MVEREPERLSVEIAARQHLASLHQHGRVVDRRRQLRLEHRPHVRDPVAVGAVDLRHAPQGVGVLHEVVRLAMRGHDAAAVE
jgi:hypothetical protein